MRIGRWFEFETSDNWSKAAAKAIFDSILLTLKKKNDAWVALSGGSTPSLVYNELAYLFNNLDSNLQSCINILLVDERAVNFTDSRSNSKMIYEAFCKSDVTLHLIYDAENAENAALNYSSFVNGRTIDVLVLGMGVDGHTASLFSETTALKDKISRYIVTESPTEPFTRISLTLRVAQVAEFRFVLIRGENKKQMAYQMADRSKPEWPIESVITDGGTQLNWYWTH